MRKASCILLLPTALVITLHSHLGSAATYNVAPVASSSDDSSDDDGDKIYTLSDALKLAEAGDTVSLADGEYSDRIKSRSSGKDGDPITIIGTRKAVIKASSPSVTINHSWITLEGFSVDGEADSSDDYDTYTNKCVVVDGKAESKDDALEGFVMKDMLVQHCGGECVRLKNFVVDSEITGNTIKHCGVYDFEGDGEGSNGEGIYVGTSFNQWDDYGADNCNGNWIADNTIATYGNECVEIKEGSSDNIIEYNLCSDQLDESSGCFCSRGDENTFRYNDVTDCEGAGIRLGGWEDGDGYQHGQNNDVYGNNFSGPEEGAMAVRVVPQGKVCGNSCKSGSCGIVKDDDIGDIEDTWDASC